MRKLLGIVALVCSSFSPMLLADEGRIPIYQPTTITQPGYYLVTRDFTASASDAVVIQANNVVVDLNGHTITTTFSSGAGVRIADGYTGVTIRNGRFAGGAYAVYQLSSTTGARILIDSISVVSATASWAINISDGDYVEVRSCSLIGTGIIILSSPASSLAIKIIGNTIESPPSVGINVGAFLQAAEIRNNIIRNGASNGMSFGGSSSGGVIIEGNQISHCLRGLNLANGMHANIVKGNSITNNTEFGIFLFSDDNNVSGNLVSENGGDGVVSQGARNFIDSNQINANGTTGTVYGIRFNSTTTIYRNNILRGNLSGPTGGLSGNTDGGGNIN